MGEVEGIYVPDNAADDATALIKETTNDIIDEMRL
jgi:hypothetical protein